MAGTTKLKRVLSLPMITFYGVGTIVGGGFYSLVGQVAGEAGMYAPLAFLTAAIVAAFSAFSFAELSSRFPVSAGEAHYVLQAFRRNWLSVLVGWMVIATGVVSAATLANAFAGFLNNAAGVPHRTGVVLVVCALGAVAVAGISESAFLALAITLIELGGLLFVLAKAGDSLLTLGLRWPELVPGWAAGDWSGIVLGAYLGFYSFVGFEDMVNVAEEVKNPQRNLPRAILLSLAVTTLLYALVSLTAVLTVPQSALSASTSPLSLVARSPGPAMAVVGMLAGVNGMLVQIVMASRVAYGLAVKGQAPAVFSKVHRVTRTPVEATAVGVAAVLLLALWFPLVTLAKATSTILLAVYALINLSLWVIKRRDGTSHLGGPSYPRWIPIAGFWITLAFLAFHALSVLLPPGAAADV